MYIYIYIYICVYNICLYTLLIPFILSIIIRYHNTIINNCYYFISM